MDLIRSASPPNFRRSRDTRNDELPAVVYRHVSGWPGVRESAGSGGFERQSYPVTGRVAAGLAD